MRATILIALLGGLCAGAWGQTTQPTTAPTLDGAATAPTTRPQDPLATPDSAVQHLFKLMAENDADAVRAMLHDPPPSAELRQYVQRISYQMRRGATIELVETRIEKSMAGVMYRTSFPNGKTEIAPVVLIGRYDRWKVLLGQVNPKRYTTSEKQDIIALSHWINERLPELNAAATQPAAPTAPPSH